MKLKRLCINISNNPNMKTTLTIIAILLLASTTFIACQQNKDSHQHGDASIANDSTNAHYICPMHPDVVSNEPGKCSKCGMDLEKRDEGSIQADSVSREH
jgi:hypothetical protein